MSQNIALAPGTILHSPNGNYTVKRVIGIGGFGITYEVQTVITHGNIPLTVTLCIKEFFPKALCERMPGTTVMTYSNPVRGQVEGARRDFISEAHRLARLNDKHPSIVHVSEVFEANETAYYVMEYIAGRTVQEIVSTSGPMSPRRMLQVMMPIVGAVACLHRSNVTHLDIKPGNIMIDEVQKRPVLIDFGLAKHYDEDGNPTSTINTHGLSAGYAPPEQYGGISKFSPASDVYALGATMLFCLTGNKLPASLETDNDEICAVIASALPGNGNDALRGVLSQALNLSANRRTPDASALQRQLGSLDSHTYPASNSDSTQVINETPSRSPKPEFYATPVTPVPADKDYFVEIKPDSPVINDDNDDAQLRRTSNVVRWGVLLLVILFIIAFAVSLSRSKTEEFLRNPLSHGDTSCENLDIQATYNGEARFFTLDEWVNLDYEIKDRFTVDGVVIKGDTGYDNDYEDGSHPWTYDVALVSLHNSGEYSFYELTENQAEHMPRVTQAMLMMNNYDELNNILTVLGGDQLPEWEIWVNNIGESESPENSDIVPWKRHLVPWELLYSDVDVAKAYPTMNDKFMLRNVTAPYGESLVVMPAVPIGGYVFKEDVPAK